MTPNYALQKRADTGFTNGGLGLVLFFAADTMFFGALFASHVMLNSMRGQSAVAIGIGATVSWLGTGLGLIAAATSVATARGSFLNARRREASAWLLVSVAIPVTLSMAILLAAARVLASGIRPGLDPYAGMYFVFTSTLLVHAGLCALAALALLARGYRVGSDSCATHPNRLLYLSQFMAYTGIIALITLAVFHAV